MRKQNQYEANGQLRWKRNTPPMFDKPLRNATTLIECKLEWRRWQRYRCRTADAKARWGSDCVKSEYIHKSLVLVWCSFHVTQRRRQLGLKLCSCSSLIKSALPLRTEEFAAASIELTLKYVLVWIVGASSALRYVQQKGTVRSETNSDGGDFACVWFVCVETGNWLSVSVLMCAVLSPNNAIMMLAAFRKCTCWWWWWSGW